MTPEERLTRIEHDIDKQNEGIRGLIVVARTCLDSFQEVRNSIHELKEVHRKDFEDWQVRNKELEEKLNILIDTVDRIIRERNSRQ